MKKVILMLSLAMFLVNAQAACVPKRDSHGRIARSATAVKHFKKAVACPATGLTTGRCPGYVVDHVYPLCACGADTPSNMQWQSLKDSKAKDLWERKLCNGSTD